MVSCSLESVEQPVVGEEEFMAADVLVVLGKQHPRADPKSTVGSTAREGRRQIWMVTIPTIHPSEDLHDVCQVASHLLHYPLHQWIGRWDQKVNHYSFHAGMVCKELVNVQLRNPEETSAYIAPQSLLESLWESVPDRTILHFGGSPFLTQKTRIHGILLVAVTPLEQEDGRNDQPTEKFIFSTELFIGAALSEFRKKKDIPTLKKNLMKQWMNAEERRIDLVLNAIVHLHERYVNLETYELRKNARKGKSTTGRS